VFGQIYQGLYAHYRLFISDSFKLRMPKSCVPDLWTQGSKEHFDSQKLEIHNLAP
jgi:hypothetical protein